MIYVIVGMFITLTILVIMSWSRFQDHVKELEKDLFVDDNDNGSEGR